MASTYKFDYQSDRHCAKTRGLIVRNYVGLITSQIDTAPKHLRRRACAGGRLITSQIDTAPKHRACPRGLLFGLITSQIDTAPKPLAQNPHCKGRSNLTGKVL